MSFMRHIMRHSMARLAAFGIAIAAAFLVTPHMLACLHKANYGIWVLISSLANYFSLLDFGIIQSVSKFAAAAEANDTPDAADRLDRICTTARCISVSGAALALIIGFILCLFVEIPAEATVDHPTVVLSLGIISASLAFQLLFRASHGLLAARTLWTTLAMLATARTLVISAAVLLWLDPDAPVAANLLRISIITALGTVAETGMQHILSLRHSKARFRPSAFSLQQVREFIRFGIPIVIAASGNLLRNQTQVFLVASFLSLTQAAVFSVARQFVTYMDLIMINVFGIMSPYFSRMQARGDDESCRTSLLELLKFSYTSSSYIGLCLVFYGGLFVTRWLGSGFGQVPEILVPMALGCVISLGQHPAVGFLVGVGRHSILAFLNVAEGVATFLLCIPVLLLWGLQGVGWIYFATALFFRFAVLPPRISVAAGLSVPQYYVTVAGTLACQIAGQCLYFTAVRSWLTPEYAVLLLACAGQFVVAAVVLFLCVRFLPGPASPQKSCRTDALEPIPADPMLTSVKE